MTKVVLSGYILVPDDDLEDIKAALVEHTQLTLEEDGCLVFSVTPDARNANKFNVYEEFIDQISFEHHQQRAKHSHWGKITQHVQRHYKITTEAPMS